MKRRLIALLLVFVTVCLCACAGGKQEGVTEMADLGGKTFVWEKEGFGSDFTLTLNEDGTYEYYEGFLSSYIGMGNWTVEDGILTLKETSGYDNTFHFIVKGDELIFKSEGSSEFLYVTVEDGDRFLPADDSK